MVRKYTCGKKENLSYQIKFISDTLKLFLVSIYNNRKKEVR